MGAVLDVQQLIQPDLPPMWQELPQPVIDALNAGGGTLWHHSDCRSRLSRGGAGIEYECVAGCPVRLADKAMRERWYLIENDAVPGFRPECGRCGQKHRYISRGCVEKPFNGLTEIIAVIGEPKLVAGERITECFRLGAVVPIKPIEAFMLKERIRAKNVPFDGATKGVRTWLR